MALPISVTYTFATATSAIPLSQLDANFTTVVNGINGIGNGTNALANVQITGGAIDNVAVGATTSSTGRFSTVTATTVSDSLGNVRDIPQNAQSGAYVLQASDDGKHISITTGGVTVPNAVFSTGQTVSIYNNSASNQTITQATSVTLRQAGTANTGNRTLAQYGLATILCTAANTFVITGAGVS
jgi:hypothetical protein